MFEKPNRFFLVSGTGDSITPLNAFDKALLDSGVGNTNLVRMSSILPPGAVQIEPVPLPQGMLVPVAYASITSSIPLEKVSAGVAVAVPKDPSHCGVIMEYSARGHEEEIEQIVRRMAEEALAYRGQEVETVHCITAGATVQNNGAAFAAVVLWTES